MKHATLILTAVLSLALCAPALADEAFYSDGSIPNAPVVEQGLTPQEEAEVDAALVSPEADLAAQVEAEELARHVPAPTVELEAVAAPVRRVVKPQFAAFARKAAAADVRYTMHVYRVSRHALRVKCVAQSPSRALCVDRVYARWVEGRPRTWIEWEDRVERHGHKLRVVGI